MPSNDELQATDIWISWEGGAWSYGRDFLQAVVALEQPKDTRPSDLPEPGIGMRKTDEHCRIIAAKEVPFVYSGGH